LFHDDEIRALQEIALQRAPTQWRQTALALVDAANGEHDRRVGIRAAVKVWNDEVQQSFTQRVLSESVGNDALEGMLRELITHNAPAWADIVLRLTNEGSIPAFVAAFIGAPDRADQWLLTALAKDDVADSVVRELAHRRGEDAGWLALTPSTALTTLYRSISTKYPRATDPNIRGVHAVGAREEIGRFRDTLLSTMSTRALRSDVEALETLFADEPELRWVLNESRARWRSQSWNPIPPHRVMHILHGHGESETAQTEDDPPNHPPTPASPRTPMDDALETFVPIPMHTRVDCGTTIDLTRKVSRRPAVVVLEGASKSGKTVAWRSCVTKPTVFHCGRPIERARLAAALQTDFDGALDIVIEDAHLLEREATRSLAQFGKALYEGTEERLLLIVGVPSAGSALARGFPDIADRVQTVDSAGFTEAEMHALLDILTARSNISILDRSALIELAQGSAHIARRLFRRITKDAGIDEVPDNMTQLGSDPRSSASGMALTIWQFEIGQLVGDWWKDLSPEVRALAAADLYGRPMVGIGDRDLLSTQLGSSSDDIRRLLRIDGGKLVAADERLRFVLSVLDRSHWERELVAPVSTARSPARSGTVSAGDKWDARRILNAAGNERLLLVGCGDRRITIRDQQIRVLNIVRALHEKGDLNTLGIVGGGFAGCTAAVAARRLGCDVTLWEKRGALMGIQSSSTRYVHPFLFDWPNENKARLPLMDWDAGQVMTIIKALSKEVKGCGAKLFTNTGVGAVKQKARAVAVYADNSPPADQDYVLVCSGFGVESDAAMSYWGIRGRGPDSHVEDIHISGSGDSGLIEVLDHAVDGLDYEADLAELAQLIPDQIRSFLAALDTNYKAGDNLYQEYSRLDWTPVERWSATNRPRDRTTTLHGSPDRDLFTRNSALLNRVAVYMLIRAGAVQLSWSPNLPPGCLLRHGPPAQLLDGHRIPQPFADLSLDPALLRDVAARASSEILREPHESTLEYFRTR
jgi:hypothetical protein